MLSVSANHYFLSNCTVNSFMGIVHVHRGKIVSYNPFMTIMPLYIMTIFPGYNNLVWYVGMRNMLCKNFTVL